MTRPFTLKEINSYAGEENTGFTRWLEKVNAKVEKSFGLSIFDLADEAYRDAYEDGVSPAEMLRTIRESL